MYSLSVKEVDMVGGAFGPVGEVVLGTLNIACAVPAGWVSSQMIGAKAGPDILGIGMAALTALLFVDGLVRLYQTAYTFDAV